MTNRISYRGRLASTMAAAALIASMPAASAQTAEQSKIISGIDEAVKALRNSPRLKKWSP